MYTLSFIYIFKYYIIKYNYSSLLPQLLPRTVRATKPHHSYKLTPPPAPPPITSPQHEYVVLDGQRLMGLSDNRNHFVIWSLTSGHVTARIKNNFRAMDRRRTDVGLKPNTQVIGQSDTPQKYHHSLPS